MGKVKEFYHDEIEEQMRRELIEEPLPNLENEFKYVISVSAVELTDVYTALHNIYQEIKAGYLEGGNTMSSKKGGETTYSFRKL